MSRQAHGRRIVVPASGNAAASRVTRDVARPHRIWLTLLPAVSLGQALMILVGATVFRITQVRVDILIREYHNFFDACETDGAPLCPLPL